MTAFQAEIEGWHDFFALSGATSATLIGLLFVAITLRTDIRKADDSSLVRVVATHNFTMLLVVLLYALYFLVPVMDRDSLGIAVILTAALPAVVLGRNWLRLRHDGTLDRITLLWSFLVPFLCYLGAMAVGWAFIVNDDAEIVWFTTITATFLVIPTKNSWVILLQSQDDQ